LVGSIAIAVSAFALAADDHKEAVEERQRTQLRQRWAKDERLILEVEKIRATYRAVAGPRALRRGTFMRVLAVPLAPQAPAAPTPKTASPPPEKAKPPTTPGPAAPKSSKAQRASDASAPATIRLDPVLEFDLTVLNASLRLLDALGGELDSGPMAGDYRRARSLLFQTLMEPQPTFDEIREFDDRLVAIKAQLRFDRDQARREATKLGG
jgi:hypothetical protein